MSLRVVDLLRRRRAGAIVRARRRADFAERVHSELALELPDEDVGEDVMDCLDLYRMGSKPRCEEAEYLRLVQEAIDRAAHGR